MPYLTFIAFFLVSFGFSCACIVELVAVHQGFEWNRPEYAACVSTISRILYPVVAALIVIAVVFSAAVANRLP